MVGSIRYRLGQFFRALSPQVSQGDVDTAVRTLPPDAQALFRRQEPQDQRHAMAVYQALRQAGHSDPDLLVAALLHDAGKAVAPCPPWARAISVLMGRFTPGLLARLAAKGPSPSDHSQPGWRRAICAHVHHAEIGARWAQQAGCREQTVVLIRRHRDEVETTLPGEDELLTALRMADAVN